MSAGGQAPVATTPSLDWEGALRALLSFIDVGCEIEVNNDRGPYCRFRGAVARVRTEPTFDDGGETVVVHAGADATPRVLFAASDFLRAGWGDGLRIELLVTLRGGRILFEDMRPTAVALRWERRLGQALNDDDAVSRSRRLALLGAMAYTAVSEASDDFVAGKLASMAEFLGDYCGPLIDDEEPTE